MTDEFDRRLAAYRRREQPAMTKTGKCHTCDLAIGPDRLYCGQCSRLREAERVAQTKADRRRRG